MSTTAPHFLPASRWRPELREATRRSRRVRHWLARTAADLERLGASPEALRTLRELGEQLLAELQADRL